MSTAQDLDWDAAYRGESVFGAAPPWNIGEPQPELAALVAAGKIRSDVLDAGCGCAELSLSLAAQGYTVVGIDLTPTAVAAATAAAAERGLTTASFAQADITDFAGYPPGSEGRFNTVIDSTLFHALAVEDRDGYLKSIHRAAAPGARYFALVFARGAFPPDAEAIPNEVTADELREAVGKYWEIDEIRPAQVHSNIVEFPGSTLPTPAHGTDEKGRMTLPAYLLSAHKG